MCIRDSAPTVDEGADARFRRISPLVAPPGPGVGCKQRFMPGGSSGLESVRVPRFPGDTRDVLRSPVGMLTVDKCRCCTWQRAHRAGASRRALSGPLWGPLGGPFGPALGWAQRAQVQQQDTYFFPFYQRGREERQLAVSGRCCPNGSQETFGVSF